MARVPTLELAYNYLKRSKSPASFEEIWNTVSINMDASNSIKNEIIAELYSDLVLDNRFTLTVNGTWGLREKLKFEDVKKQYNYIDSFDTTEEFSDIENTISDETDIDETIDLSRKVGQLGDGSLSIKSIDDEFDEQDKIADVDIDDEYDDDYNEDEDEDYDY